MAGKTMAGQRTARAPAGSRASRRSWATTGSAATEMWSAWSVGHWACRRMSSTEMPSTPLHDVSMKSLVGGRTSSSLFVAIEVYATPATAAPSEGHTAAALPGPAVGSVESRAVIHGEEGRNSVHAWQYWLKV